VLPCRPPFSGTLGIFQGSDSEKSSTAAARHAGEFPVFTYSIQPGDAEEQLLLTRRTLAGLSPKGIKTALNLGDEAFDSPMRCSR
jgi:hypothetical protein